MPIAASVKALVERWNGRVWKVQPNPATSRLSSALMGVSCTSASACTAVGSSEPFRRRGGVLIEHWNGKRWSIQPAPGAKGHAAPQLNGISCRASTNCTAVGYYFAIPGSTEQKTLAERHRS
jgi:hypothetical protein